MPLLTAETLLGLVAVHDATRRRRHHHHGDAGRPDRLRPGRCATTTAPSPPSSSRRTPPTSSARSARSTAGSTPSTAALLREALAEVGTDNAQGEKYLTDVIGIARGRGLGVRAHLVEDLWQTEGVNDKVQLARLGAELNRRTVEAAMRDGAIVIDPATTWIDADVTIGPDTVVHPGTQILGATSIGRDCVIGPDTTLRDVEVDDGASVVRTPGRARRDRPRRHGRAVLLPPPRHATSAPTARSAASSRRRTPRSATAPRCRTSAYCGDATVGPGANIGAGTIFANYDGVTKGHTTVGAHSFVGSNSVIVAPRTIGDGAYVAAGSAVVSDVEPGQLAVTRAQQRNIDGWVARRRAGTATDEAARAATQATTAVTGDPAETPAATEQLSTEPKDANG